MCSGELRVEWSRKRLNVFYGYIFVNGYVFFLVLFISSNLFLCSYYVLRIGNVENGKV